MRPAKLCVTVTGRTMAELRKRRDAVVDADLVELRLDTATDPDAAAALEGRRLPVIITCRPAWEGGHFSGSEDERRRLLGEAQARGAEFIDVEWKAGFTDLIAGRGGRGVIVSSHEFGGMPDDAASRVREMQATGAEVVKFAATAHQLRECLALLDLAPADASVVMIAMGDAGLASRVLAAKFGSRWTYAGDVAPGQISAARLQEEFAFRRVTERTAVYGVVGKPVMHSLSPVMHNAAFRAAKIDAVYLPLAADSFDDFREFAARLPLAGASVTAPFKIDAFEAADECDEMTRRVRAANTLRLDAGRWQARNTDVEGFLAPLVAQRGLRGSRATILGAGGAARAAADALTAEGAVVSVAARRREQAVAAAAPVGAAIATWPPARGSWDVLVNATPLGTLPDTTQTPLPDGPFDGDLVYDLVYNPPETTLLRAARAAGCRTLGGLDMLVAQAARQFEWWTGVTPSQDAMRSAAWKVLHEADVV